MTQSIDMDELLDDELQARRERGDYISEEDNVEEEESEEELEEEEDDDGEDGELGGEDEDDAESSSNEEEDEEDGEDEEELEEEPKKEKLDVSIPKPRFDEVIGQREFYKERATFLQERLEEALAQSPAEEEEELPTYDYDGAEQKYIELVIEGETSKAASLRQEINKAQNKETESKLQKLYQDTQQSVKEESTQALDEDRFKSLVEVYENEYDFLDQESDDYNEEAVDTVNTLMSGYVAAGKGKAEALKMAVKKAIPFYETPKKVALGGKRKKAAVKRNVRASKKQPASIKNSKSDKTDETFDVRKASDKQFRDLSKREKAVLRGDIVGQ